MTIKDGIWMVGSKQCGIFLQGVVGQGGKVREAMTREEAILLAERSLKRSLKQKGLTVVSCKALFLLAPHVGRYSELFGEPSGRFFDETAVAHSLRHGKKIRLFAPPPPPGIFQLARSSSRCNGRCLPVSVLPWLNGPSAVRNGPADRGPRLSAGVVHVGEPPDL